ncbi:MAG: 50S ribosomal protein L31e [archaeon]
MMAKEGKSEGTVGATKKIKVREVKKLDDVKNSPENKRAIAEAGGKIVADKNEPQITRMDADSGKKTGKPKKGEVKVELEREYVVPLRRGFLKVPKYRRAKKAVRVLKEFMVRHMGVRDGDLRKVKIDGYLNNEIWFRGIKKPMGKVRVRAKKIDGVVYVELAELPDVVKFAKARDEKRKLAAEKVKPKKKVEKEEVVDKDKDGVEDKVEEKEDKKAGMEMEMGIEKAAMKKMKHSTQGSHIKKTMPVRQALKK